MLPIPARFLEGAELAVASRASSSASIMAALFVVCTTQPTDRHDPTLATTKLSVYTVYLFFFFTARVEFHRRVRKADRREISILHCTRVIW